MTIDISSGAKLRFGIFGRGRAEKAGIAKKSNKLNSRQIARRFAAANEKPVVQVKMNDTELADRDRIGSLRGALYD